MRPAPRTDFYSPREIALAAGVAESDVLAALAAAHGSSRRLAGRQAVRRSSEAASAFVTHEEAVRIGRVLARAASRPAVVDAQPETGDGLQWQKAGLLEVADVVVVHKADLPGAERTEADLRAMWPNLPI